MREVLYIFMIWIITLNRKNEDVMMENSNKNPVVAATQRDLIAGEVSKDIARRKLIPAYIVLIFFFFSIF